MIRHYKTLFLLLFAFFCSTQLLRAQIGYGFLLQVPVVDSFNGNQWAVGQQFSLLPDPGFTGIFGNAGNTYVNNNGYIEDSIYVYGPGIGSLLLSTVDCHGDTITTTVSFDSSFTTHVADTIFLCGSSNPLCAASFTVNNTPGNPTLSFQGSSSGLGVATLWSWSFGDGGTGAGTNASHTYNNNGTYQVNYAVQYSTGCWASAAQWVTVTGGNIVCSTSILPSQWGNATNFSVNYTASGTPVNFQWTFGDGGDLNTGTNGIFHTYSVSGTYNVCVVTTFSDGCMDTLCQPINIVVGGQGSCAAWFAYGVNGQTVTFQDSSIATAPSNSWWWDFGDGATDSTTGSTVSHTYAGQGPYTVHLEIFTTDTCFADTTRAISLQPQGTCSAGFTHAPDTSGQYTILAYNTSVGTNLSYLWDFGDGSTSTQPYPVHQFAGAGTYNICLSVTQPTPACTDTFCDSVTVTQKQASAFTFAVWNPATAIAAASFHGSGLSIAPHPVRDRLRMTLPAQTNGPARIRVYNAFGQLVADDDLAVENGKSEWDATQLPDGMYVVRIGAESARFWVMR